MMKFLNKFIGVSLLVALLTGAELRAEDSAVGAVVARYGDNKVFEGAVLVARGEDILYTGATGFANREWRAPNGPDVKYRLASLTKGFTAALVLKLVEEGKLSLDDVISDHLADYGGPATGVITIDQLLRHTSGMQHTIGLPGWFTGAFRRDISDADYMAEIASLPLAAEPGGQYIYSNLGYFLLGKIAEQVTGETYEQALRSRILNPLGMQHTGFDAAGDILEKRADGYVWAAGGGFRNQGYVNMKVFGAGAGLYSTVGDMFRWQQGLMGGKVLSAESMALMFAPGDAIGWRVEDWTLPSGDVVQTINYDGQIDGFTSYLAHFKESGITVILLGNIGTGAGAKAQMTKDILMAVKGQPLGKLPLSYRLTKALVEGDLAQGIADYRATPDLFDADERRLEAFGNELGWAQMPERSLMVRKLATELFPKSMRAQVMLARAQAALGDCRAAEAAYRQAQSLLSDEDAELRDYLSAQIEALACGQ